jgi:hypothetical protein
MGLAAFLEQGAGETGSSAGGIFRAPWLGAGETSLLLAMERGGAWEAAGGRRPWRRVGRRRPWEEAAGDLQGRSSMGKKLSAGKKIWAPWSCCSPAGSREEGAMGERAAATCCCGEACRAPWRGGGAELPAGCRVGEALCQPKQRKGSWRGGEGEGLVAVAARGRNEKFPSTRKVHPYL